ncbi:hypothetical protein P7C73_g5664, partial [Tremellales sp. Uapishka_1]
MAFAVSPDSSWSSLDSLLESSLPTPPIQQYTPTGYVFPPTESEVLSEMMACEDDRAFEAQWHELFPTFDQDSGADRTSEEDMLSILTKGCESGPSTSVSALPAVPMAGHAKPQQLLYQPHPNPHPLANAHAHSHSHSHSHSHGLTIPHLPAMRPMDMGPPPEWLPPHSHPLPHVRGRSDLPIPSPTPSESTNSIYGLPPTPLATVSSLSTPRSVSRSSSISLVSHHLPHQQQQHQQQRPKKRHYCTWTDQPCSRTEKPFASNADLKRHMNMHMGIKPFKCPAPHHECGKEYGQRNKLVNHIKRCHPDAADRLETDIAIPGRGTKRSREMEEYEEEVKRIKTESRVQVLKKMG